MTSTMSGDPQCAINWGSHSGDPRALPTRQHAHQLCAGAWARERVQELAPGLRVEDIFEIEKLVVIIPTLEEQPTNSTTRDMSREFRDIDNNYLQSRTLNTCTSITTYKFSGWPDGGTSTGTP